MDEIFQLGIKRNPGQYQLPWVDGLVINLGSGRAPIEGAINLDRPDWEAPWLHAFRANSVAVVHAYHFIEHLDSTTAMTMLREIERVLKPGATCNIVVPHAMVPLAYQAPDHRSYWTEEGWQDTFYSAGYDSSYGHEWDMDITWMMVAGVSYSNLCVLLQLTKRIDGEPYPTPWRRQ